VATWDLVAYEFKGPGASAYAKVPTDRLAEYSEDLRSGRLDEQVESYLRSRTAGPASNRR
jgi:hypothetical protein